MNTLSRLSAFLREIPSAIPVALLVLGFSTAAHGQFFIGAPTITDSTTSGSLLNTLVAVPNQGTQEIDVTGQITITNATPSTQILQWDVNVALDPSFPAGAFQLQVSQSGYLDVPLMAGAQINGWAVQAQVLDAGSNPIAGWFASANQPIWPLGYGPGAGQIYGPTVATGPLFPYAPLAGYSLDLHFTSDFQGMTGANTYVWDFPINVKFVAIPEPGSLTLLSAAAMFATLRRRKAART